MPEKTTISKNTHWAVFRVTALCCMFFLVINSCRKWDIQASQNQLKKENRFFKISSTTAEPIQRVARSVNKQNQQEHFIDRVVKNFGFPIWDKALYSSSTQGNSIQTRTDGGGGVDTADLVYIPFANENINVITAVLVTKFITVHGVRDSLFYLLPANFYPMYGFNPRDTSKWSAQDAFNLFSAFESRVFNHRKFQIMDNRLFKLKDSSLANPRGSQWVKRHLSLTDSTSLGNFRMAYEDCVTWDYCYDENGSDGCNVGGDNGECTEGCQFWQYSVEWCTTYDGGGGGGGGSTGDGGPMSFPGAPATGGSGGGGGWYNTSPCRTIPDQNDPAGNGCSGMPMGWFPIDESFAGFNPYQADTVGYSSYLKDSFPCMYHLIHDSLQNLNYIAQLAGADLFHDSAYMHLTFDVSSTLTSSSQAVANTLTTTVATDSHGYTHYYAVVRFNPYYLQLSTKEFKVSSAIHEVMHAIFRLRWEQYQQWLSSGTGIVDSFYMKAHYPIYWANYVINGVPPPQISAHEIMGTDYVDYFTTLVRPFYNPAATSSIRDTVLKAMGYGGLQETTAWGLLPNQGIDTCKYRRLNATAQSSLIGTYSQSGCPAFTTSYLDSLHLTTGCY
jgi:hypothetical protein